MLGRLVHALGKLLFCGAFLFWHEVVVADRHLFVAHETRTNVGRRHQAATVRRGDVLTPLCDYFGCRDTECTLRILVEDMLLLSFGGAPRLRDPYLIVDVCLYNNFAATAFFSCGLVVI